MGSPYQSVGTIVSDFYSEGSQWGLGLNGNDGVVVCNAIIRNPKKDGVEISKGSVAGSIASVNVSLSNMRITGAGRDGIRYDSSAWPAGRGIETHGLHIEDAVGAGIRMIGNATTYADGFSFNNDFIRGCGEGAVRIEKGRFRNLDFKGTTAISNTGAAFLFGLDGQNTDIIGGRVWGATIRDYSTPTVQVDSFVGAANLTDFDISGTQGVHVNEPNLTGTKTNFTIGGTGGNVWSAPIAA